MKVIRSLPRLRRELESARGKGLSVGFVPTMGCLHRGHASLIRRSRRENCLTVVSIFVNPLQFGPKEDFARYPKTPAADRDVCRRAGASVVFIPREEDLWAAPEYERLKAPACAAGLCGRYRPGHFDGVCTIVALLFRLVKPGRAYFGLKDYQQFRVIQEMTRRRLGGRPLVVGCPTIRERNGLAMSSRNRYLSAAGSRIAASLFRALEFAARRLKRGAPPATVLEEARSAVLDAGFDRVQYLEWVDALSLKRVKCRRTAKAAPSVVAAAAWLGRTRLIDNVLV